MLEFTSSLFKNEIYSDVLEVNDTEIFGVNVRIYRYGNKTNQDGKDGKQDLLPAMIYFHGGGWTFGSLGKLLFYKNIFANSELDGCIKYCSSKHLAIHWKDLTHAERWYVESKIISTKLSKCISDSDQAFSIIDFIAFTV